MRATFSLADFLPLTDFTDNFQDATKQIVSIRANNLVKSVLTTASAEFFAISACNYGKYCLNLRKRTLTSGYIKNDTVYSYVKDYQGNVRSVVRQDGAVVESDEYYPYGGLFSATASVQPYKYGAKELDRTHGLDLYDFTICEGVFDTLNDTNKVDTKIILQ